MACFRIPLLFVLAALVTGAGICSRNFVQAQQDKDKDKGASANKGKIEGTKWSSLEDMVKGKAVPADFLKLEFSKDGKLVYLAGPIRFTGTYELGKGNTVTMHLDQVLAGRKDHIEMIVITGTRLRMMDSDGTSLSFRKVP